MGKKDWVFICVFFYLFFFAMQRKFRCSLYCFYKRACKIMKKGEEAIKKKGAGLNRARYWVLDPTKLLFDNNENCI